MFCVTEVFADFGELLFEADNPTVERLFLLSETLCDFGLVILAQRFVENPAGDDAAAEQAVNVFAGGVIDPAPDAVVHFEHGVNVNAAERVGLRLDFRESEFDALGDA